MYDSHTHFFGVGLSAAEFFIDKDARTLTLPSHLEKKILIKGFGWSDQIRTEAFDTLCKKYPEKLFCLSYIDGHKSFVSNNLIKKLNIDIQDNSKINSGIFVSEIERDKIYKLLPLPSQEDLTAMALQAQSVFIKNNISKVRHLTGSFDHWTCLKNLEKLNQIKIQIEVFFSEFMGQSLDQALKAFTLTQKENTDLIKASGLKIFYDGSFGSNTAFVSSANNSKPRISKTDLITKMKTVLCDNKYPLAVHTIGDLALEDVLAAYNNLTLSHGKLPTLHLEHAPIFTEKSLDLLKSSKMNCVFHFQPSHWILDIIWYNKNKNDLISHKIYPFEFLDKYAYQYHFGSDAPVVEPTKENMMKGFDLIKNSKP